DPAGVWTVAASVQAPRATDLPMPAKTGGDAKGLIGDWRVVGQQRAGRPVERPRDMTLTFTAGRITLGGTSYSYSLDPTKSGHIRLNAKIAVHYGLYHLDGATLTLCIGPAIVSSAYDPKSKPDENTRPTKFDPESGTMVVLKRSR